MIVKEIVFTGKGKAELLSGEIGLVGDNEVLVETAYTAISAGTERANLMRMPN
ncbi:MAG: theronine dehydrogenase, partial [Clostridiales bacterium]|nr:theronine dehydrogenase [Clostridiales bacterium]